jgi:ribosome-binding protein aMBF1 (putative translation factor)
MLIIAWRTAWMTDDLERYLLECLKDEDFAAAHADEQDFLRLMDALAAQRAELGLSQREVAQRMGTSQSAVSELERLEADPRVSTLQRYARALGGRLRFDVGFATSDSVEVESGDCA